MSSVSAYQPSELPPTKATGSPPCLEQRGKGLVFLPWAVAHAALVVATFNVYLFWAKTSVRRYIWSTTWLGGAPLNYTGSGREIAWGCALSVGILLLVLGLPLSVLITRLNMWLQQIGVSDTVQMTGNAVLDFIILAFAPVVLSLFALLVQVTPTVDAPISLVVVSGVAVLVGWTYALTVSRCLAFQYLLRHTCWRGVTGDVTISPWSYGRSLLMPELSRWLTFGWTGPWRYVLRWDRLLNGARFGAAEIRFKGNARVLYPRFSAAWFALLAMMVVLPMLVGRFGATSYVVLVGTGAVVAALVSTVWLTAHYNQQAYGLIAQSISVGDLRFRFVGSRRGLVSLYLTNLVINFGSAGLGYYYTQLRVAKYIAAQFVVDGDPLCLLGSTGSDAKRTMRLGEGLDSLFAASHL